MSVSVSQIGIGRSLDRSIDQSRFPGQSLDQSICVCRCLYKEQHPPTRSHFCRKILRLVDLFSISSSHPLNLSRTHTAYPRSRDIVFILCDRTEMIASPILKRLLVFPIAAAHIKHRTDPRTCKRIHDAGRTKSRGRESAHEMRRSTTKKAEKVGQKGGRCTDDRPGFLERS